ncbi:hypothetical protein Tco_0780779 [Tanacetum coccineum]
MFAATVQEQVPSLNLSSVMNFMNMKVDGLSSIHDNTIGKNPSSGMSQHQNSQFRFIEPHFGRFSVVAGVFMAVIIKLIEHMASQMFGTLSRMFGVLNSHGDIALYLARKGKSKSTNGGQFTGPSVKQNVRYEPKANTRAPKKGVTNVGNTSQSASMLKTTGNSSKKDNVSMSNSFSALNDEEEDDEEDVQNVYDESANLIQNTKAGGRSSFTAAVG